MKPRGGNDCHYQRVESNDASPEVGGRGRYRATDTTAKALVVMIDAGHGGKDPGALGHKGTIEKEAL